MKNNTNSKEFKTLVEETITRLEPRLRHLARRQIARAPEIVELSPEDLYQQMVLCILEKANSDDAFLHQKDCYIAQFGLWAAMNHIRYIRYKYSCWHVELECDTENELNYRRGRAGPEPASAVEVQEVYDLLSRCPTEYQRIWYLLSRGYTARETGQILGLSVYTVGARKKRMLRVVEAAYLAPLDLKSEILKELS